MCQGFDTGFRVKIHGPEFPSKATNHMLKTETSAPTRHLCPQKAKCRILSCDKACTQAFCPVLCHGRFVFHFCRHALDSVPIHLRRKVLVAFDLNSVLRNITVCTSHPWHIGIGRLFKTRGVLSLWRVRRAGRETYQHQECRFFWQFDADTTLCTLGRGCSLFFVERDSVNRSTCISRRKVEKMSNRFISISDHPFQKGWRKLHCKGFLFPCSTCSAPTAHPAARRMQPQGAQRRAADSPREKYRAPFTNRTTRKRAQTDSIQANGGNWARSVVPECGWSGPVAPKQLGVGLAFTSLRWLETRPFFCRPTKRKSRACSRYWTTCRPQVCN